VHNGEEPSPQIGAGLPETLFSERAGQAGLDEIVCARPVAGQGARIAAQPWNFCLKQWAEIVLRIAFSASGHKRSLGGTAAALMIVNIHKIFAERRLTVRNQPSNQSRKRARIPPGLPAP
jgi:hypothetical protein